MKFLKVLLMGILSLVIILGVLLGILTLKEYKPALVEDLRIENNQNQTVKRLQEMKVMTFNIGYAGLGENEDFVMDGGKQGIPENKEVVLDYFEGIKQIIEDYPSDFYLMQEVDIQSRRSYDINQLLGVSSDLGQSYSSQFAYNYKAPFVPFPVSFTDYLGHVESGIATFTNYRVESSTRYQFPGSFSWPLRIANLKRAMMVSVFDVENSEQDLYIVNLHMSAYDSSGTLREQEMAFLKAFLEEQDQLGNYVIVGGDFNQTFPEAKTVYPTKEGLWEAYPIEPEFLPSGYSFQIDMTSPSCRLLNQPYNPDDELTQYYIIDGYIVSNNIDVLPYDDNSDGVKTLDYDFMYSDHNPVVLKFLLQ